ncbi:MAG: MBL fold metallo-hydrolase [Firmicutes bacterium]|nr:MBL fold metallo-hydrolase [Bacillota bacterium]
MQIQLIRHATVVIEFNGQKLLLDPMLSEVGAMPAVPEVSNTANNPVVGLPVDITELLNADAILITHTHRDHFDEVAMSVLPRTTPVFCQPADVEKIAAAGFTQVQAVEPAVAWQGINIFRTDGQHGTGKIGQKMGPVSGFVLEAPGELSLYITGDTVWCDAVAAALSQYRPQVIICFAGAAQFSVGDPITMTKEEIKKMCQSAPAAKVIVVHLEAWNHCSLSRQVLQDYIIREKLQTQVYIPDDGEKMEYR